jgi:hypothetical protein
MKKTNFFRAIVAFATVALLTTLNSCSTDEQDAGSNLAAKEADSNLVVEETGSKLLAKGPKTTARATLGSFNFADFDGETSSGSGGTISNRAYFNPTTTDDMFYFDVDASGYRVFKCFAPKSNRTEIKEKQGLESSLSTAKDMEYIAKLESIPSLGVTVGQVHNRGSGVNRPLLRVYVYNGKFYIKTTTNNPSQSTGTYSTITGPSYTAGTDYTLRIRFSNGDVLITITTTSATLDSTITPTSSWNSYSTKYYLKAGVYTEGNDLEPKLSMKAFDK